VATANGSQTNGNDNTFTTEQATSRGMAGMAIIVPQRHHENTTPVIINKSLQMSTLIESNAYNHRYTFL
jgi:hypothetical protein